MDKGMEHLLCAIPDINRASEYFRNYLNSGSKESWDDYVIAISFVFNLCHIVDEDLLDVENVNLIRCSIIMHDQLYIYHDYTPSNREGQEKVLEILFNIREVIYPLHWELYMGLTDSVQAFDGPKPVIEDLIFTYREYSKLILPGMDYFLERILDHNLDLEFKELVETNILLLHRIMDQDSSLVSLQQSLLTVRSITIKLFIMEARRLDLNLTNLSDESIRDIFKGVSYNYKNSDGSSDLELQAQNLKAARDLIELAKKADI